MSRKSSLAKKAEAKKPSKRLYLVYSENRSGGEVCQGDEDSAWPCHEDIIVDVYFQALYRNPPENIMFYDSYEVTEDIHKAAILHMAVIRHSDGDSFGHSSGLWHVVGFYHTLEQATLGIEKATKGTGYKPWEGYFSGYEDDQVHILNVFDK